MDKTKQTLPTKFRPTLRLSEVDRLIRKHRIIVPPPSRSGLKALCEDGSLETSPSGASKKFGWLVYEDSFWKWAREIAGE